MEGTKDGIILSINNDGISCTLSKFLPQYIAKNMGGFVDGFLEKHNYSRSDVDFWAIHPGGRRIIEEAQNGLGIYRCVCMYVYVCICMYVYICMYVRMYTYVISYIFYPSWRSPDY
jgi:alpha-pyrone synthase